jgi:O-antigen/teichoic acid export membrane protein
MDRSPERRTAVIIWGALVAGPALFLVVALALPLAGEPAPGIAQPLLLVLTGLVLIDVALSWLWAVRARLIGKPGGATMTVEEQARTRLVIAAALCEGAALFAVVVFMVTREPLALALFAIAFGALLSHFPGDRHWARLCRGNGAAPSAPPNRLMRG